MSMGLEMLKIWKVIIKIQETWTVLKVKSLDKKLYVSILAKSSRL